MKRPDRRVAVGAAVPGRSELRESLCDTYYKPVSHLLLYTLELDSLHVNSKSAPRMRCDEGWTARRQSRSRSALIVLSVLGPQRGLAALAAADPVTAAPQEPGSVDALSRALGGGVLAGWLGSLGGQLAPHAAVSAVPAPDPLDGHLLGPFHPAEYLFGSDTRPAAAEPPPDLPAANGSQVLVRMGPFAEPYPMVAACARGWFDLPGYRVECSIPYAVGSHATGLLDSGLVDVFLLGSTALAAALSRGVELELIYVNRVVHDDEVRSEMAERRGGRVWQGQASRWL